MHDLIVVGAGPGGSMAAFIAAKLGLDVLLVEAKKLPRNKTCGGGLPLNSLAILLEHFNFKEMKHAFIEKIAHGGKLHDRFNLISTITTATPNVFFTLRHRFDYFLAKKAESAGAELLDGSPVRKVKVSSQRMSAFLRGGERVDSKMVIIADGANSRIARTLGMRTTWKDDEVALGYEVECEVGAETVTEVTDDLPSIHFGIVASGYGWIFPKKEVLSIGIGALRNKLRPKKQDFHYFFNKNPLLKGLKKPNRIHGHLIPFGGIVKEPHARRTLLVGDAAGFVDPFLGEGIRYALLSGKFAAEVAAKAITSGREHDTRLLATYGKKCFYHFGKDFRQALMLREVFLNPRLYPFFIALLKRNPLLARAALGFLDGSENYSHFLTRLPLKVPKILQNMIRKRE